MINDQALLVEGNDDCHVVWSLLEYHKVSENFGVFDSRGIENLLKNLPVRLKGSNIATVGVVMDADLNILGRWDALRSVLSKAGYKSCPDQPNPSGVILNEENLPKFGAWVMPNNILTGMLEDFVSYLVPEHDSLWGEAEVLVRHISEVDRRFPQQHEMKARMHTWLAWQQEPGTPMGLAITKKYLAAASPSATPFLTWVTTLFAPSSPV